MLLFTTVWFLVGKRVPLRVTFRVTIRVIL